MSEQDNLQLANEAIAAINAHDIDGYVKLLDDSYVGESEIIGTIHGRDGARQLWTHPAPARATCTGGPFSRGASAVCHHLSGCGLAEQTV
jgi:hypothetical protein